MSNEIVKHVCPTCGGNLRIDTDKQMYECQFCGVTFDYDYFREDNVLSIADKALSIGEFISAKNAYDFMLTKEPHNFRALRGSVLVSLKMNAAKDLAIIDKYYDISNRSKPDEAIDKAITDAMPENKEYFEVMKKLVDTGLEYVDQDNMAKEYKSAKDKGLSKIESKENERDGVDQEQTKSSPVFIALSVFIVLFAWVLISFCVFATVHKNPYDKPTTRSNIITSNYSSGFSVQRNDAGTLSYRFDPQAAEKAREKWEEEEREAKRELKRKKSEWEKEHEGDKKVLAFNLILAFCIGAGTILLLVRRNRGYNKILSGLRADVEKTNKMLRETEERMEKLRMQLRQLYIKLKELDPTTINTE